MKTYGEWMYRSTFSWPRHYLEGSGQFHAPAALPPGKRAPGTHWIGGWVDLRAGVDDVEKRKFLTLPGLELRHSVLQPVASRYTDWAIINKNNKWNMIIPTVRCFREVLNRADETIFQHSHSRYHVTSLTHSWQFVVASGRKETNWTDQSLEGVRVSVPITRLLRWTINHCDEHSCEILRFQGHIWMYIVRG
jgi:hypothetical protein